MRIVKNYIDENLNVAKAIELPIKGNLNLDENYEEVLKILLNLYDEKIYHIIDLETIRARVLGIFYDLGEKYKKDKKNYRSIILNCIEIFAVHSNHKFYYLDIDLALNIFLILYNAKLSNTDFLKMHYQLTKVFVDGYRNMLSYNKKYTIDFRSSLSLKEKTVFIKILRSFNIINDNMFNFMKNNMENTEGLFEAFIIYNVYCLPCPTKMGIEQHRQHINKSLRYTFSNLISADCKKEASILRIIYNYFTRDLIIDNLLDYIMNLMNDKKYESDLIDMLAYYECFQYDDDETVLTENRINEITNILKMWLEVFVKSILSKIEDDNLDKISTILSNINKPYENFLEHYVKKELVDILNSFNINNFINTYISENDVNIDDNTKKVIFRLLLNL